MSIISMTQLQFVKSDANLILRLAKFIGQLFCIVGMICHLHAAPNTHIQSNPINPKYPTKTVKKEATTQASPKKKKALVAVYGVFSRSLRRTWPQINRMIVEPLEKDYEVEIYGLNNQVDNINTLDDKPIQKSSIDTINTNHKLVYQEVKQSQLDEYIKLDSNRIAHSWLKYKHASRKNAVRQFYLEQHVADYISNAKEDYAIVVALIADLYPYVPILTHQIDARDDIIYTSGLMDAGGVTNGYYVGTKNSVSNVMATIDLYDKLDKPADVNNRKKPIYEQIVSETLKAKKLERRITDMIFCKSRNNQTCAYTHLMTETEAYRSMSWSQKLYAYIEQFPVLKPMKRIGVIAKVLLFICIVLFISRQAIKWFKYSSKTERSTD